MKKIILIILIFSGSAFGQFEFKVNSFSDSTQRDPQIAKDVNGNYIIVWDSENHINTNSQSDIVFQLFDTNDNKIGTEVIVNDVIEGEQERPAVAMNADGDFIIVWASHTGTSESIFDIKARLYKSNLPVGGEFLVNTTTDHSQTKPDVSIHTDGSFVVVWESWNQDGSNKGVYAQRFDNNAQKIGSEILVNTTTQFSQGRPVIKHFYDGKFLIVWESWKQDATNPPGYGVYGKIFEANGTIAVDEFLVNTYVDDYQWFADAETFSDGNFAVVWCSWEQDGHDGGIYMQKFNSSAEKISDEILVNKSTANYQWLPKIAEHNNGNVSVVWSSWRQDGSREGVYTKLFNSELNALSFETQVNVTTEGYQWEPTFITGEEDEILVTWAGWIDTDDYEIFARRVGTTNPQGYLIPSSYEHIAGRTTSGMRVYVVDSSEVTGDEYEVTFAVTGEDKFTGSIKNLNTNTTLVSDFPIDKGMGFFYLTDIFEGVAVEFIPELNLRLDVDNSYFKNVSGTNILFTVGSPAGNISLAPIDIELRWGSTDTLSDGRYASPLDTAYGISAQKVVATPFYGWNSTDNERVELFVNEVGVNQNYRWDPGEPISFLTPPQYDPTQFVLHAMVGSEVPAGNVIMPNSGDINYVLTTRPLTADDIFRFETLTSLITDTKETGLTPNKFALFQNYPNPFNPSTTIVYSIPKNGLVKLNIYNVLGQKVRTLVNEAKAAGEYKAFFSTSNLASGVYFYSLEFENKYLTKKMLLVK